MLPVKGAGVTHRVSGADARRNDQLGGKVGLLATAKTRPRQGRRTKCGLGSGRPVRFPARFVWVLREDAAWLVLAGSHGWLHGDYHTARADAQWLAQNLGLPVRSAAG
jgi:hypothetical protein